MTRLVLTFHGIGSPTRELSPEEEQVWISTDTFVEVLDQVAQRASVHLTFDDGNDSDVTVALPELLRRGLTAEFFVLAGKLDQPGFLGRADVLELVRSGMSIGSHGMHHRSWRKMSRDDAAEELVAARAILAELISAPVTTAACPFGAYDRTALSRLKRAGYGRVYTSDGGRARDTWLQPRTSVRRDHPPGGLAALDRGRPPLARAVALSKRTVKRWR